MKWPTTGTSIGALIGAAVALYPGLVPRDAVLSGIVVTVCLGIGGFAGMAVSRVIGRDPLAARPRVLCGSAAVFVMLVALATWWQSSLRVAVGSPGVGWGWATATGVPAAALFAAIALSPRFVGWSVAAVGAVAVGYLSPGVAAAAPPVTASAAIDYGGLRHDLPLEQRAQDVVSRWVADGGLARRAVVVAVPTGSGWIDAAAVAGFRSRFDGDVAVLGLQYSAMSSWKAFVTDRGAAGASAIALVAELDIVLRSLPASARPKLYLYGQSLGAIGADAARAWATEPDVEVTETLETGGPGDSVPRQAEQRTVLANAGDPVVQWSPSLLWRPAQMPDDTHIIGRTIPRAPWLPIVSFLQTSVDLLGALDVPVGSGHRYGTEQGGAPTPAR